MDPIVIEDPLPSSTRTTTVGSSLPMNHLRSAFLEVRSIQSLTASSHLADHPPKSSSSLDDPSKDIFQRSRSVSLP
jgi:hypothetical protein